MKQNILEQLNIYQNITFYIRYFTGGMNSKMKVVICLNWWRIGIIYLTVIGWCQSTIQSMLLNRIKK